LKIGCIQTRAAEISDFENSAAMIIQKIDAAASLGCDLAVFPECVYPSYYPGLDEKTFSDAMERLPFLKKEISEKCLEHGIYVAAGLMEEASGKVLNKGVLWGPDGAVLGETAKSNLWHFDRKYVEPGKEFPVLDTCFGKVGLIVCADGRAPEICRILALRGARIIIDMANLVTTGKDLSRVTNPQIEYMLPARARENGVWIVLADKVGLEAGTILNSGGSCIIDPSGRLLARASSDKEEILVLEIDPDSGWKDLDIPERNPSAYSLLVRPTSSLPVVEEMLMKGSPFSREVFTSVVDFPVLEQEDYLDRAFHFLSILEDQDVSLICLPSFPEEWGRGQLLEVAEEGLLKDDTLVFAALNGPDHRVKGAFLFSRKGLLAEYRPGDGTGDVRSSGSGQALPIFDTIHGKIGLCVDKEAFIPELIRCMMLDGVHLVIWADSSREAMTESIARSRASENRIFLARTRGSGEGDTSFLVNPGGQVVASTAAGLEQAASALLNMSGALSKMVVPGTDVVFGRRPELYGDLVRPDTGRLK